jgi:hypothetical protein
MRTNSEKTLYLSAVSADIAEIQSWLARYASAGDHAYFMIKYLVDAIVTVRIFDPKGVRFSWGASIMSNNRHSLAAIESALMVYAYAVDHLGFKSAHFDVRKGNGRIWQFHEPFGAQHVSETDMDYFYCLDGDTMGPARQRYPRFWPNPFMVHYL